VSADRLGEDVAALAAMTRDSAGEGERAAAAWVRDRLAVAGAREARLEPYRYSSTYVWAHLVHVVAGLLAAWLPPLPRAVLALAAFAGLELDVSGRRQPLRRLLPRGDGANAVARIPAVGDRRATLVLVAHLDAARTGLSFKAGAAGGGAALRRRRRAVAPMAAAEGAALLLAALGLRRLATALLGASAAGLLDIARSPTVPGANDNASGVAALVELARRLGADPPPGVEVQLVACGSEESGMGGFRAWLDRADLRPESTFVLGLDTLGCGEPILLRAEATLLPHRYRDEDNDLVEAGAARAGLPAPERWRIGGWTDAVLATFKGLPAASLLSIGPEGRFTNYHVPTDTADRVDLECVERCVAIAEGTARELADR
jgi:hypothetical protein